jgi:hypothetical protein
MRRWIHKLFVKNTKLIRWVSVMIEIWFINVKNPCYLWSSYGRRCSVIISVLMYAPLACRVFHSVRLVMLLSGFCVHLLKKLSAVNDTMDCHRHYKGLPLEQLKPVHNLVKSLSNGSKFQFPKRSLTNEKCVIYFLFFIPWAHPLKRGDRRILLETYRTNASMLAVRTLVLYSILQW